MSESWAAAAAYEPYVGRWSRRVAQEFLRWLDPRPGLGWLDVGCGTGALSHNILERTAPRRLLALDHSLDYLAAARRLAHGGPRAFVVADAQALPAAPATFDLAVSGLVLNFIPDPRLMIAEMLRALRPGGRLALYVWDYAGRMELMRYFWDAVVELDPAATELDEGRRFPICRPEPLRGLLAAQGVERIEVRPIDVATVFRDFDEYWEPFLGGQGPAPGYAAGLAERQRDSLRELIRKRLPHSSDGSIALVARAWAAQGRSADA